VRVLGRFGILTAVTIAKIISILLVVILVAIALLCLFAAIIVGWRKWNTLRESRRRYKGEFPILRPTIHNDK